MEETRDVTTSVVTDPAAVSLKHHQSVLPKRRELVVEYPGQINYLGKHGQVAGCRVATFLPDGASEGLREDDAELLQHQVRADFTIPTCSVDDTMNTYFRHRANLFVVDVLLCELNLITVVFSTALDKEDLEQFHEAGAHTAVIMQGIRGELGADLEENLAEFRKSQLEVEARIKACDEARQKEAKAKAEAEAEVAEQKRLAELGRLAELQGWRGRIASLEETNRKLGGNG